MSATGMYDPEGGQETWRVMLQLDDSRLKGHSVHWAQFDEDPIQLFRVDVDKNRELLRESLAQIADDHERLEKRSMLVAALWNRLFRQVTGEQVHQLAPGQETVSVLMSNEPRDVVWIATKTVRTNGNNICWASSVQAKLGSTLELRLSEENALDLEQLYLETIGED